MESTKAAKDLNGVDVAQLEAFRNFVRRDPSLADRSAWRRRRAPTHR